MTSQVFLIDFRLMFPEFANVSDGDILMLRELALVTSCLPCNDMVTLWLTAHYVSEDFVAGSTTGAVTPTSNAAIGAIKKKKVKDLEITYETGGSTASPYSSSKYGQRAEAICRSALKTGFMIL